MAYLSAAKWFEAGSGLSSRESKRNGEQKKRQEFRDAFRNDNPGHQFGWEYVRASAQ